jgi:tetratricopeptide (TPR) repeat protein
MVEVLRRERPGDPALLDDLQKSEFDMGRSLMFQTRDREAADYYRRAIADGGASLPQNLSLTHKSLGAVLIRMGSLDEATAEYQAAATIDEERVRQEPSNGRAKLDLSYDYVDWGVILLRLDQPAAAVEKYRAAEKLRAAMAAADPRDARAGTGLVSAEWRMGDAMSLAGDRTGAAAAFQRAAAEGERMIAGLPDSRVGKSALAEACWNIGLCYMKEWRSCAKAEPWFLRARGLFRDLGQPTPNLDQALKDCGVPVQ